MKKNAKNFMLNSLARFVFQSAFVFCIVLVLIPSHRMVAQSKYRLQGAEWQYQPTILPVLTPDKNILFFDRKLHPKNTFGFTDQDDAWYAEHVSDSVFSEPKNLQFPRKTQEQFDMICSVAPDGKRVFVAHVDRDNTGKQMIEFGQASILPVKGSLRVAHEQVMQIENLRAKSKNFYAKLAPDNQTLLLALDREDSFGDLDLYVSVRKGTSNVFTEPKNLGFGINTPRREGSPVLAADGVTLYFSSEGRGGFGKADMFMARRESAEWNRWSVPINLGAIINSRGEDSSFDLLPDGTQGIFVSTDSIEIGAGLYRFTLAQEQQPARAIMIRGAIQLPPDSNDSTNFIVQVRIKGTERVIAQSDAFSDYAGFVCAVPRGEQILEVFATYPHGTSRVVECSATQDTSITLGFGQERTTKYVYFSSGSAKLPRPQRETMCAVMDRYMIAKRITIIGHTDDRGSASYNRMLSRKRAEAAKHAMEEVGVEMSKITIIAKGKSEPSVQGISKEARQKNRRVEIVVE
jgi:OmpA-OmpF porin, OOP family